MEKEEVKVLAGWASPFAMRAVIGLIEKQVDYEYIQEDVLNDKSQRLITSNPLKQKIPVLIHNGKCISESGIILEYIDETWPGNSSFVPSHPYDKAQARFWINFIDKKYFDNGMAKVLWEEGDQGMKNVEEYVACLEELIGDQPYFMGNEFGIVDISFLPFAAWFKALETISKRETPLTSDFPRIGKWVDRCKERECVKKGCADSDKLVDFGFFLRERYYPNIPFVS